MYLPKTDIYNILKELGYYTSQTQPNEFNDLPAIIFRLNDNSANLDLDNEIISQDIEVNIDIWAEDSVTASKILSEIEEIMRNNQYIMNFSSDVPNIGNLYHINSRFNRKYG